MKELTTQIEQWGRDRGIIQNGKPMGQAIKTLEEVNELLDALNRGDIEEAKDAIGDIYVTLVMVAATLDVYIEDCVSLAYEEIKDRKGYLRADGTFIKEN